MKLATAFTTLTSAAAVLAGSLNERSPAANTDVRRLAIICDGSEMCSKTKTKDATTQVVSRLRGYIDDITTARLYRNGEYIACVRRTVLNGSNHLIYKNGGYCAFLQGTSGNVGGDRIKSLITKLESECSICGSVPIGYFSGLERGLGGLHVDYVSEDDYPCPDGLC